ncbi:hypothetical protein [Mangrovibacillus cuniculi]|uniref:hypothetical protein n=1 Tax=Mangrovibacillus cuniculi TaxID=2593652 RepID=UPI001EFA1A6D|nr:hypothetical protein [Mangrovibacillus cuniculi]
MKKEKPEFLPDTEHSGRDKAYIDVDRFINEGMGGGSVFDREESTNIPESDVIVDQEDPPHKSQ